MTRNTLFFHTFYESGCIRHQGQVLGVKGNGWVVAYFSWLTGESLGSEVVSADALSGARFYPTAAAMLDAYNAQPKQRDMEVDAVLALEAV